MEGLWSDDDGERDEGRRDECDDERKVEAAVEEEAEEKEAEEEEYACGGEALHEVLPLEVVLHVMGMLDAPSVGRAECVCRAWRVACHSPFVWEVVFRRHFASRLPSSVADAPQGGWRERCVQAARSLRQKRSSHMYTRRGERAWEIIKWSCACGFDRVLEEFLRVEGASVSLDMLNGIPPSSIPSDAANGGGVGDQRTRPIHLAATCGSAEVVEILALAGVDVNASDGRGNTAVGIAAAKGYLDAVEVLLRHGAGGDDFAKLVESQKRNRKGARPLSFQAAAGGHIKIMEVLLAKAGGAEQARAMVNAVEARTGKSALHYAAENGRCEMMKLLLKQGADKDSLSLSKQSALHLATLSGHCAAVQLLLEHGAKLIFSAAEAKSKKQPAPPLHLAAGNQDEALMSLFLEHGLSVNLADVTGRTPLHFALRSQKKTLSFIRFLVKHGADATAMDQSGQGALHCALKSLLHGDRSTENVEICKCLIEARADVHLKDPILCLTPHCRWNSVRDIMELIDLFIEHGVDVRDPRIGTPLLTAAASQLRDDLLEAMLDRGMDPNGVDGSTEELPLHIALRSNPYYATKNCNEHVVELLIKRGANVNRPSGYNASPVVFSVPDNQTEFLDLMLQHGADINAKDGNDETLLHHLARSFPWDDGHLDSIQEWMLALIKRGADPGLCLRGDQAPQAEADDDPADPLMHRWFTFLRSIGVPFRPAQTAEAEEEGEPDAAIDERPEHDADADVDCQSDDDEGEEREEGAS